MHASQNVRKSRFIAILTIVFSTTLGFLLGKLFDHGYPVALAFGVLATLYTIVCTRFADSLLLTSLNAKLIKQDTNHHLYKRVAELANEVNIPPPMLYYIDDTATNILSLSKNPKVSIIVITTGLMEKLTTSEVEAVLAHELTHIQKQDSLLHAYAALIIGFFPFFADLLRRKSSLFMPITVIFSLFTPISGFFMQIALSPKREFEADAQGVLLTRYPEGLIHALQKIAHDAYPVRTASLATAHFFIVNPFHGKASRPASSLFMTHPPTKERLSILESL